MINEFIFIFTAVIDLVFILVCFRLGRHWLYGSIVTNLILISTLGAKLITIFGFITNAGNVFYAAVFFATHLLVEHYGKREAKKGVWVGFASLMLFLFLIQFTIRYVNVAGNETVTGAIENLFNFVPRIALASSLAYLFSQYLNVWIYSYLYKKFGKRLLFLRDNLSNLGGQLLDSALFFSIAFYGSVTTDVLIQTAVVGFASKVLVGILGTPLLYTSYFLKREEVFGNDHVSEESNVPKGSLSELVIRMGIFLIIVSPVVIMGFFTLFEARSPEYFYMIIFLVNSVLAYAMIQTYDRLKKSRNKVKESMSILVREKVKDEALLSSIGDGMVATDASGIIVRINLPAAKMLGWKAKELIGKKFLKIVPAEDAEGKPVHIKDRPAFVAFATGKTTSTVFFYIRKDKKKFPAAITVTPVILDKKIIGAIEIFRDITREKEIDQAKNEFVSLASHQLRTPAGVINWYAEILLGEDVGTLNQTQKEYLKEIYYNNKKMTELVNTLLTIEQIELGTFTIEPRPNNVAEIFDDMLKELRSVIAKKKLRINKRYRADARTVETDPKLLRVALRNMLLNSVEYTPQEGSITIGIRNSGASIAIEVSDTGCGIPAEAKDRIFTKFFRAANARTIKPDGTGLGLYISKSILEALGGKISFKSSEGKGKGTTFFVTLPYRTKTKRSNLRDS